jgi:hypothetical protein
MISVKFNDKDLFKDIMNIAEYSNGFIDGAKMGKTKFMSELGVTTIEMAKEFIDTNAKMEPQRLHHVYEWYQTGSPDARLYDIDYTLTNNNLIFTYSFKQSQSIARGASTPFFDKAQIMESGIPITIKPKNAKVLAFQNDAGETVFTPNPVQIDKPGGDVAGQFENVMDIFFNRYFTQAFLQVSGIAYNLESPAEFHKHLKKNSKRSDGVKAGYNWMAGAIK